MGRFEAILSELNLDKPYNLHSHTQFCDGRDTMAACAAEAVRRSFSHYGFSPHSPAPFHTSCNMSQDSVADYLAEFRRLRTLYDGRIKLLCGMEIDFFCDDWGPASEYFQELPLDYRIGSVHFITSQQGEPVDVDGNAASFAAKMERHFHNDLEYVVRTFCECTHRMLDLGGFDIIGHFDKIGHNADHYRPGVETEKWYVDLIDCLADHVAASGVTVEINTKAYADHRGRLFPSPRLIERLKHAAVPMIVSTDAHWANLIEASREPALQLLR